MLCAGLVGRVMWCPERCVGPACGVSNQRPGLVGRVVWCPERCVGPACSVSNQRPCSVRVL